MKIYISHSKAFDFTKELYDPVRNSELFKDHEFIFPHADSESLYPTRELLQNKGCDLIIAEVSFPATGQGIELGWANMLNIPIVCIYKDGSKVSGSLNAVSQKFLMYHNTENMIEDITGLVKAFM